MRLPRYFSALLLPLLAAGLQAQTTKSFVFHKDGKVVLVVPSTEVDSITFSADNSDPGPEPPQPPGPPVYDECPDSDHPHLIDLGLPSGVKWACCNVGAADPGQYGNHYAWGETEAKEDYSPGTYTVDGPNLGSSIRATRYDVAYVRWGEAWCMPSLAECQELVDNCTWTWEQYDDGGNYGIRVKGKNGNSIFLPAGGFPNAWGWNRVGSYGTYWTSTHASGTQSNYFRFDSSYFETTSWDGEQYVGQSVRPVGYSETPKPDPGPGPTPSPDSIVVRSLSEISNNKVYVITTLRGGLVVFRGGSMPCSSTNSDRSTDEGADQWAILKIDGEGYYLYNVAVQEFHTPGGGFTAKPTADECIDVVYNDTPNGDYLFKFTSGEMTMNNNNAGWFMFDNWRWEDDGNRLKIIEVGDFDPSGILSAIGSEAQ